MDRPANFPKAAELYEKVWKQMKEQLARDKSAAAQKKLEELAKRTAYFYKQAGDLKKSAQVLELAGALKFAAELYQMAGDKIKAAELFQQTGAITKAAELYEEAGDVRKASEIRANYYVNQNNLPEAAHQYELAGDLFSAADIYLRMKTTRKPRSFTCRAGTPRPRPRSFTSPAISSGRRKPTNCAATWKWPWKFTAS